MTLIHFNKSFVINKRQYTIVKLLVGNYYSINITLKNQMRLYNRKYGVCDIKHQEVYEEINKVH